jgi:polysaccharide export outer membrane protein
MGALQRRLILALWGMLLVCAAGAGCAATQVQPVVSAAPPQPWELSKVNLPEYTIEPPDILQIDALYLVPLPPYRVQSLDVLAIRVPKAPAEDPIAGLYTVDPDGTVNLGTFYGSVRVAGLTIAEVKPAIEKQLTKVGVKDPATEVSIAQSRGLQQVRGTHLVRPDGTISLGTYGSIRVTGLTLSEAKRRIEQHLSQYLQSPEITVDVAAYNSKVYYVIYDGGGAGQQVYRLPITGNETILDAVSQLNGLSPVSDMHRIWVARPTCTEGEGDLILPVDWFGITARGRPQTNYQLMPGDRLFVCSDPWVTADTKLARRLSPFERIFGFSLLGANTIEALKFNGNTGFGGSGGP